MKKFLLLLLCAYVTNVLGCDPGYHRDANDACVDIDECATATDTCDSTQVCSNTVGAFSCGCASTHFLNPNADDCQLCPDCLPKTCDASNAPTNGAVEAACTATLANGASCTASCNIGYVYSGSRVCTQGSLSTDACTAFVIDARAGQTTEQKKAGRKADFAAIWLQIKDKGSIHRKRRQVRSAYKSLLAGGESFNVARSDALVSAKFKARIAAGVDLEIRPYKTKTGVVDNCAEADLDLKNAPPAYDIPVDLHETALICRDTTPVMKLKMTVDGGESAKDEYEASCWGGSAWDAAVAKSSADGEDEVTCSGAKFYVNSGSGATCTYTAPTNGAVGACGSSLGEGESCTHTCDAGYEFTASATCLHSGTDLVFTAGSCTACDPDENDVAADVCVADDDVSSCPAGQGQQAGTDKALNDRSCGNCLAEYYSPEGSIVCTQYSAGSTAAAQAACAALNKPFINGGNSADHSCGNACTGGSRVIVGSTSCDHCDPEYGNDGSGSACQQCPSETYNSVISPIAQFCNNKQCPVGEGSGTDVGADHVSDDCVPCAAGTFSDVNDEGQCETHKNCPVGEGKTADGTASADTVCAACQGSTFSSTIDKTACQDHTVIHCDAGEELSTTPSASVDGVCTGCAAGNFQPSADSTNACSAHTVIHCDAGEELSTAPSASVNGVCTGCAAGNFQPSADTTNACSAHTVIHCDAGEELSTAPSASVDGVCTGCGAGNFQPSADTTNACSAHTVIHCDAGEELTTAPSASVDGVCTGCGAGNFQPSDDTTNACSAHTVTTCDTGYELSTAPSASVDGVCNFCASGYGGNGNGDGCVICDVHEFNAGQTGFDALCADKACPVGYGVGTTQGSSSNSCEECTSGHFSASSTTGQCVPIASTCGQGKKYLAMTVVGASADTTCASDCDAGTFQASASHTDGDCVPIASTCGQGKKYLAMTAVGASADTTCASDCDAGTFQASASHTDGACAACGAGSVTDKLANTGAVSCTACSAGDYDHDSSSQTACQACGAGSVTNTNTGAISCTACLAGKYSAVSTSPCAACAAGSVTDTLADPGGSTCTACLAGEYSAVSTSACAQCAAGVGAAGTVDADSDPATACSPCAATEYSTAGLTACIDATDRVIDDPVVAEYTDESDWDVPTCASGEFKHLDGDSITCEACSKALYKSTYTVLSTATKHPHGKCCVNRNHKVCSRMNIEYRSSCSSAVCAA